MASNTCAAVSNIIRPKQNRTQNYFLVWVDESINENDTDCQNTLTRLRSFVREVNLCKTPEQCIDLLNEIDDGKAFIISSGALGQSLVLDIHAMEKVDAIFIFCNNKALHEQWVMEWPKIEGVFTSINPICESLKKAAHKCDEDTMPMSFVPKRMTAATPGQENLNQLPPSYMHTVLFKDIILEIKDDANSVKELVEYCRSKGIPESELQEFEDKYDQKKSIWWYTREMFLYGMLNFGIRSLDMEIMIKMGFFIRHLHERLSLLEWIEQHDTRLSGTFTRKFIVYRGQGLSKEDFQNLVDSKGGLLSFNNFLSTSKRQKVAMEFVQCAMKKYPENMGILFIMTIDSSKISTSTTPFALIDGESAIPQEQEVLFSMHSIFHVDDIKRTSNNSRLWEVRLTLTDDNDPQLAGLTEYMRNEITGSGWFRIGHLMRRLGHYHQGEQLYSELLKKSSNDSDRAVIYHQLGLMKDGQGECKEAIAFYEKSIDINRRILPANDPRLATSYNCMGLVYGNMSDHRKAFEYFNKSLRIREKALPPEHPQLAQSYNNIGMAYCGMLQYSKALEYYNKSLKIREIALPSNHPDLAQSYSNIGMLYDKANEYVKALSFLEKALAIRQKSLPSTHPLIKETVDNVNNVKKKM